MAIWSLLPNVFLNKSCLSKHNFVRYIWYIIQSICKQASLALERWWNIWQNTSCYRMGNTLASGQLPTGQNDLTTYMPLKTWCISSLMNLNNNPSSLRPSNSYNVCTKHETPLNQALACSNELHFYPFKGHKFSIYCNNVVVWERESKIKRT